MSRKSTRKTQKEMQEHLEVENNTHSNPPSNTSTTSSTNNSHNPKSPSITSSNKIPTQTNSTTTNNTNNNHNNTQQTSNPQSSPQQTQQQLQQLQLQPQQQQEDAKQQQQHLQPSNYVSACQWAAQQSAYRTPQIVSTPPPKEPVRPKGERISATEIQVVQNYIEKCLQLYMNQNEVITALHLQANIEPGFTSLVWQKLEQQNPEFFTAYNLRLRVKEQITAFNYLASQQLQALQKSNSAYFQLPQHPTVPGNFFRPEAELGGMGQLYDLHNIQNSYNANSHNNHDASKEEMLDTNLFFDQSAGQTV